ncbi:MAG: NMD3-related protein [Nanoarchaeota archaeon]
MHKKYHSDYYEAIIQLRPSSEESMRFVENRIKKSNAWISKKTLLKTGVDYYVSSNRVARQIGKGLKTTFKGELKESRKLFSRNRLTSKDMYRVTVCFRLE